MTKNYISSKSFKEAKEGQSPAVDLKEVVHTLQMQMDTAFSTESPAFKKEEWGAYGEMSDSCSLVYSLICHF